MIFDSDSSDSGKEVGCFCEGKDTKKESIQLTSVRNQAISFATRSNYNRRQRKLAHFLSVKSDGDSAERRQGDWIMCWNKTEGSMKTYPWTSSRKQKFELVPWRKQKRHLDIINFTAWEPDELSAIDPQRDGVKPRRYKQHPLPVSHNQEIRRLIRLRFLFSIELQRQKQMKILNRLPLTDEGVVTPRQFENILEQCVDGEDVEELERDKESSSCDENMNQSAKLLNSKFAGYFGSDFTSQGETDQDSNDDEDGCGSGKQQNHWRDDEEVAEASTTLIQVHHCMSEALSAINYSTEEEWRTCSASFKCNECKRYPLAISLRFY